MPEATSTFLTPGSSRDFFIKSINGPWSVPSSLQMVGWTQLRRRQTASTSGREQRIWYMLAVGPPISLTTPVKSGWVSRIRSISASTDCWLRLWMMRPS